MKITILLMNIISITLGQYQWTLFDQEHVNLCNEAYSCGGRVHTMCYKANETHPRCKKFAPIQLGPDSIKSFMMGHNGLRNKVATNPQQPATDMQFLVREKKGRTFFPNIIEQPSSPLSTALGPGSSSDGRALGAANVFFHPKPIMRHWEALALSTWFSEKEKLGNNLSVGSLQSAGVSNYTQLVWARTQFVGCGAATMYGGHLIVCYYYPKGNIIGQPVYSVGRGACTGCPQERASCSHVFRGLCGIGKRTLRHRERTVRYVSRFTRSLQMINIPLDTGQPHRTLCQC
uniref:SCP domain-containing protein n=1 Tax=Anopheles stephensi TaxID=30069 RepID=A0A182Y416_ANOST